MVFGADRLVFAANWRASGMITSTIRVVILVPVFFMPLKRRALRRGHLHAGRDERD